MPAVFNETTTGAAFSAPGEVLILCFLFGITFYLYRDRIVHSHVLGAAGLIATVVLLSIPKGDLFVAVTATYFTVYVGLFNPAPLALSDPVTTRTEFSFMASRSSRLWPNLEPGPITGLAASR